MHQHTLYCYTHRTASGLRQAGVLCYSALQWPPAPPSNHTHRYALALYCPCSVCCTLTLLLLLLLFDVHVLVMLMLVVAAVRMSAAGVQHSLGGTGAALEPLKLP